MATPVNKCDECYVQNYPECTEEIIVAGGFVPAVTYIVSVRDHFGNEYRAAFTANYAGELEILTDEFPQGLFNRFSGGFQFEFYSSNGCDLFTLTICENSYTCIILHFVNKTDSESVVKVGCCEQNPSITLSISQECIHTEIGVLSFIVASISLVDTNGSYEVQRLFGSDWITVFTQSGLPSTINTVASLQSSSDLLNSFRVVSGETISNVVEFQVTPCE